MNPNTSRRLVLLATALGALLPGLAHAHPPELPPDLLTWAGAPEALRVIGDLLDWLKVVTGGMVPPT